MTQQNVPHPLVLEQSRKTEHPHVAILRSLQSEGYRIEPVRFYREVSGIAVKEPIYFVPLAHPVHPLRHEEFRWSWPIEEYLIKEHIPASSQEGEAERGAYILLQNLGLADHRFGRDYSSHVLYEVLQNLFGGFSDVSELLDQVAYHRPHASVHYLDCYKYLEDCIAGYANTLTRELRYRPEFATPILVSAVCQMFDERHHLTLRDIFFPQIR